MFFFMYYDTDKKEKPIEAKWSCGINSFGAEKGLSKVENSDISGLKEVEGIL